MTTYRVNTPGPSFTIRSADLRTAKALVEARFDGIKGADKFSWSKRTKDGKALHYLTIFTKRGRKLNTGAVLFVGR